MKINDFDFNKDMCNYNNYRVAGYFRGVYISREHNQSSKIKIVKKKINVEDLGGAVQYLHS